MSGCYRLRPLRRGQRGAGRGLRPPRGPCDKIAMSAAACGHLTVSSPRCGVR